VVIDQSRVTGIPAGRVGSGKKLKFTGRVGYRKIRLTRSALISGKPTMDYTLPYNNFGLEDIATKSTENRRFDHPTAV